MGDEAFARRYYADRAELQGLGVPITSGRDEFTGEELYTLREEQYFLPPIDLNDQELAALLNCLGMLDGQFAYAEPLRLALQNLALGRHVSADPGSDSVRVNLLGSVYTPEIAQRLAKLELAISKQRTVRFSYRSLGRRRAPRAADQPVRPVRAEQRLVRDRRRPRGAARRSRGARPTACRGWAARSSSPPAASATSGSPPTSTSTPTATGCPGSWATRPRARRCSGSRPTARSSPAGCTAGAARSPSTTTARRRWSPSTPTWSRCPSWCCSTSGRCGRSSRRSWPGWSRRI